MDRSQTETRADNIHRVEMSRPAVNAVNLIWVCLLVEGGLLLLGLGLGWSGFCDSRQPLNELKQGQLIQALAYGSLAALPLLVALIAFDICRFSWTQALHELTDRYLVPLFAESNWLDLLLIGMVAGFCEELLFRWCIQGGLQEFFASQFGPDVSVYLAIAAASLTFGLCHWVNSAYAIYATLAGAFFGWTMWMTGSWLVPAVAHALFDFLALIYITRLRSSAAPSGL